MALASSDFTTRGIREDDLVLHRWSRNTTLQPDYNPPLELCSPGLCRSTLCPKGSLLSMQVSSCLVHALRTRTEYAQLALFAKTVLVGIWCYLPRMFVTKTEEGTKKKKFKSCIGKPDQLDGDTTADSFSPVSITPCPGTAQIFRLSELKDATNGFKEFNELGRGSYGFVYKAVLADGRQVPIKRPNAATIIHTNSREFEMELEILCSVRHCNIVNLLGYCSEKRERLLVYEYMPHGTLHDHLHGGLSSLSWSLRLKILLKAARGLKYLHKEVVPPIVHRDVKASNILLDSDWGARIAVFGLVTSSERDLDLNGDMKSDVYSFGIVLLEILTGRKAYNRDYTPASIVDWAVPLIKQGKAAVIVDRYAALPETSSLR
ncbi:serine/threonine-protein kinase-like protein CCR2 [Hibiscus syriacus]|uniref:serine/threonine-protein kinase-like protein CCR2 n=1 Tax=Hibiscus syriacus TaxID=106335 RepID=UPI001923D4DC|nr:serine/threonine-protein kinase-like protein CCR2 [Hibiscus syriacus]